MNRVILDIGEGAALNGQHDNIDKMLALIAETADSTHYPLQSIIIKPQLFVNEPPNTPLDVKTFAEIVELTKDYGLSVGASVFDEKSTRLLLSLEPDAVKIANRSYLRALKRLVPRGIPVYTSISASDVASDGRIGYRPGDNERLLCCVSRYPATSDDYKSVFCPLDMWYWGLSDHTPGLELFREQKPAIIEKHFAMDWMKGPSVGPWSIGLKELEIICEVQIAPVKRGDNFTEAIRKGHISPYPEET